MSCLRLGFMKRASALFLCLVLLLATFPAGLLPVAFAAETYTVTVTDGTDPIEGATVKIGGVDETTNEDGVAMFVAEEVPETVSYQAEAAGYRKASVTDAPLTEGNLAVVLTAQAPAPVITQVSGAPTAWTNLDVTLAVEADSNAAMFKMDGGEWQASNEFTVTANGTYSFFSKNIDNIVSSQTDVVVSKIDKTVPTGLGLTYNPAAEWRKDSIEVTVTATDVLPGLADAAYKMDDGEWQVGRVFTVSDKLDHVFYVRDAAGNRSQISIVSGNVKLDQTAPAVTVDSILYRGEDGSYIAPVDGKWYSAAQITVSAADSESGLADSAYKLDNGAWQTTGVFSVMDDNAHTVFARDKVGNPGSATNVTASRIDSTAPSIAVMVDAAATGENYTKDGVSYTVTVSDAQSGVTACRIDDETPVAIASFTDMGGGQYSYVFTGVVGKSHTFHAVDAMGNEAVADAAANYDSRAAGLAEVEMGETTVYPVNFSLKNGDVLASVAHYLTGGKYFSKEWVVTVKAADGIDAVNAAAGVDRCKLIFRPLDSAADDIELATASNVDGVYTFGLDLAELDNFQGQVLVVLQDKVGNISTELQVTTDNSNLGATPFMIENTAPVISDVTPDTAAAEPATEDVYHHADFTFAFHVADPVEVDGRAVLSSGLCRTVVTVNGVVVKEASTDTDISLPVNVEDKAVNDTDLTAVWNGGKLETVIKSYDMAGNAVSSDTYTYYIDQTVPVVSFRVNGAAADAVTGQAYAYMVCADSVDVVISATDIPHAAENEAGSAGVKSITYYTTTEYGVSTTPVAKSGADITDEGVTVTLESGFKGYLYAFATDNIGNTPVCDRSRYNIVGTITAPAIEDEAGRDAGGYLHPAGIRVESAQAHSSVDHITVTDENASAATQSADSSQPYTYGGTGVQDKNSYAATGVKLHSAIPEAGLLFSVSAEDAFFGIKRVKWTVMEEGAADRTGEFAASQETNENWNTLATDTNLVKKVSTSVAIHEGNHNNMVLLVEMTSNSGSVTYDYYQFGIDTVKPVVNVAYNESVSGEYEGTACYKAAREITLRVTERNFDPAAAAVAVMKNGSAYTPAVTQDWVKSGSGDAMTYTKKITVSDDGNYTFDMVCTDRGGLDNKDALGSSVVTYDASGKNPTAFTVDKTAPVTGNMAAVQADTTKYTADGKTWYSGDVDITIPVSDNLSGVYQTVITINGREIAPQAISTAAAPQTNMKETFLARDKAAGAKDLAAGRYTALIYTVNTQQGTIASDGSYTVTVAVTDNAGNTCAEKSFTVYKDVASPVITADDYTFAPVNAKPGTAEAHTQVLETEYGYYFVDAANVTVKATDKNTVEGVVGVRTITVKALDIDGNLYGLAASGGAYILTRQAADAPLPAVNVSAADTVTFTVNANFKGQIYTYATDFVGNYPHAGDDAAPRFFNPNGAVVEDMYMHKETSRIAITATATDYVQSAETTVRFDANQMTGLQGVSDETPETVASGTSVPLYSAGQTFRLRVEDTYSGIRQIDWKLCKVTGTAVEQTITAVDGMSGSVTVNEAGNLPESTAWRIAKTDAGADMKENNLVTGLEADIALDAAQNNLVLFVQLTDRAGNISYDYYEFGIDKTGPQITVSYDNNSVDSQKYFKSARTATIVVTDANFMDSLIKVTTGGKPGNWAANVANADFNATTHTLKVSYASDGDYKLALEGIDMASNTNLTVDFGTSAAPTEFTVDMIMPTVSVSYDNMDAANENYYKADRTATISVNEHNFSGNRVIISGTANNDGTTVIFPSISGWSDSGNSHSTTIAYTADAQYTFSVEVSDLAGNGAQPYGGDTFYIDKTAPVITIGGVENGKAYKEDIVPGVTLQDTNYDSYQMTLTRTRMADKNADVTAKFTRAIPTDGHGGSASFNTFAKEAENDGIYTLSVQLLDKAGNTAEKSVVFTANRFGSVYEYDDYLISAIRDTYVKSISGDLIVTEYNADRLVSDSLQIEITRDGKPLTAVEYKSTPEINNQVAIGESGWYQYRYTISKNNFSADGLYKIFISSADATGNTPENANYEDKAILFWVDSVAPELSSVVGLENSIVNANELQIKYTAFDTIGLKAVTVYVDGAQFDSTTDFAGDPNNFEGAFTLAESTKSQGVRILVEDLAGNTLDTDDYGRVDAQGNTVVAEPAYAFCKSVTVSTNLLVRWYANKPLFWGTIGGVAAIAAGTVFVINKKRVKVEEAV